MKNINAEIKNGLYVCDTVDIINGVNAEGNKTILWKLKVLEGPYKDGVLDKWFTLRTEDAKDFLKKELALAELVANSGAELESRKAELYGKSIRVEVKINDSGYPNFYIKGVVKPAEEKPKGNTTVDW